jgi:hypothetical protein
LTPANEPTAHWHGKTVLVYGTFGNGAPAGKAFHRRSLLCLLLMAVSSAVGHWLPPVLQTWLFLVPTLGFVTISRSWWQYLGQLDELERRLQLEAMAWTYVVGIGAAVALGVIARYVHWNLNPGLLILLEPIRAWRLYRLTRKF